MDNIKNILERHKHYLNRDVDGWESMRACLCGANLIDAYLGWADLRCADLSGANLEGADLGGANLKGANLDCAYMLRANLSWADLSETSLREATLEDARLVNAKLCGANLEDANLVDADLRDAYLRGADLKGANMMRTNLERAKLYGANLANVYMDRANLATTNLDKKEEYRKGVILSESIKGWKRCEDDVYVELEIPKGAVVFCINGKRCRTNKAKVLSVSNGYMGRSLYDRKFTYEVGEEIEIEDFDLMYNVEFGSGIHFFKTRKEAEEYYS